MARGGQRKTRYTRIGMVAQVPNGFRVTKRARDNKWAKLMRFAYEIRSTNA